MSIGQRLKALRKEAGLSQKQVAEALKMSKPIVSQYESDQRTPSVPKLIRFSRFYKASLDYICENVEKKNEFYLSNITFTYELPKSFLKKIKLERLVVGIAYDDVFRISSVKMERGTSYPYQRSLNLIFRPTF